MKNSNKLLSLQILRSLATLIVVLHHIDQSLYQYSTTSPFFVLFRNYGQIGVDIFFVLSGYIMYYTIKNNNRSGGAFFLDRFFRIYPVYWAMTFLLMLSLFTLPIESYNTSFTGETLIKSFLLIPSENPNGVGFYPFLYVGWTLIFEFFFYTILSISLAIHRKYALIIATISLSAFPLIFKGYNILGNSNNLIYEFVLGILIAYFFDYVKKTRFSHLLNTPLVIIPALALNSTAIYYIGFTFTVKCLSSGVIVLMFLFLEDFFKKNHKKVRFFVHLGDISYSSYLVHPIILGWFKVPFSATSSDALQYTYIAVVLVLIYILSAVSYKHIETNKRINTFKDFLKKSMKKIALNKAMP